MNAKDRLRTFLDEQTTDKLLELSMASGIQVTEIMEVAIKEFLSSTEKYEKSIEDSKSSATLDS